MGPCISKYSSEDFNDDLGKTALHFAVEDSNLSKVKKLLSRGANVNARDKYDVTPLHSVACKSDHTDEIHLKIAELLLKHGADVNARDTTLGSTPLQFLIQKCDLKMVKLFLNFKADIKAVDNLGWNHLFPAATNINNVEVLQLLIDLGLSVNHRSGSGDTPLHCACRNQKFDSTEVMKVILRNGANVDATNLDGSTPLIEIVKKKYRSYEENLEKSFKFIVEHSNFNVSVHNYVDILTFDYRHRLYPDYLWQIILQHFAKLQSLGISIHPDLFDVICRQSRCYYYFELYKEELLMAKNTKVSKFSVTFYDVLTADKKRIRNYAADRELIETFDKGDLENKFPTYGAEMVQNLRKGIKRRELFNKSAILLSNHLGIFNSMRFVRDILECITSKKDLLKLCDEY